MKMTAPPFTGLGEVHRRYLEERGLTGETIKGADFYSAQPGERGCRQPALGIRTGNRGSRRTYILDKLLLTWYLYL